jgi:hypothetical protein
MKSVCMIAVLAACSHADRGGVELLGGDDSATDDTAAGGTNTQDVFDDTGGIPNGGDDSGDSGDSGASGDSGDSGDSGKTGDTGGTIDTAGDCPVTIPKDVVVVTHDAYMKEDGVVVYVCKNKVLSLIGSNATVFVGSHGQLWNNSSGNTIYAKTGADLAFYDSHNDVYIEGGVDVEDDSKDGTLPLVICTSVTFVNEPAC